jgi:Ca2+-binding RTX toxin-like protein
METDMSGATKWGSEITVIDNLGLAQRPDDVAGLADGRFVVTWSDNDGSSSGIWAQILHADGSKDGGAFLANTTSMNSQYDPVVTALADGGFVLAWQDYSQSVDDPSAHAVRAQVFAPDGTKSGAEFLVNTTTAFAQDDPAITSLTDGRFVIAWKDASSTGDDTAQTAVRVQIFNADGTKDGGEFVANTTTVSFQEQPTVTALDQGRFLVAWKDSSQAAPDTSSSAVRAQVFNADGSKSGNEFVMNTTTQSSQEHPAVAGWSDGRFVAAWTDFSGTNGDSDFAVRAQIFSADGSTFGTELLVNTTTASHQEHPTVATLADGRFVVAWQDESGSGDDPTRAIRAQVFEADGSKSGPEFLVNTTTAGIQLTPSISELADGRFVIAWSDQSTGAVRGQIFDARVSPVNLAGTNGEDELVGTGFDDTMDGAANADSLEGGDGNDRLLGDEGRDTLVGGDGDDRLDGGAEFDVLDGGNGNDTVIGGEGNDDLTGGAGDDTISAGGGIDDMAGGTGNDVYFVEDDTDSVEELASQGIDTVVVAFDYTLDANVENLTLTGDDNENATGNGLNNVIYGNNGNNLLDGLAGSDTMNGGSGADTMIAGAGKDLMTGGGGLDRMVFKSLSDSGTGFAARDVINTFAHGDKVDLSALDANSKIAGNQAFTFVQNFSGAAGQLQWDQTAPTGYLVSGDVNGDGAADFSLQIYAAPNFGTIHGWDFIL